MPFVVTASIDTPGTPGATAMPYLSSNAKAVARLALPSAVASGAFIADEV